MQLEVRQLRSRDLPLAAKLMDRAWAADYGICGYVRYSPALLLRQFEAGAFWVGAFKGDKLVGINASLPRTYRIDGERLRGGIPTYLSVEPNMRRRGVGAALIDAIIEMHESRGDSLLLPFFDREGRGQEAYKKVCPRMVVLKEGRWWARLLRANDFWDAVGQDVLLTQFFGGGRGKKKGLVARALSPMAWTPPPMRYPFRKAGKRDAKRVMRVLGKTGGRFDRRWSLEEVRNLLDDPMTRVIIGEERGHTVSVALYRKSILASLGALRFAWFDGVWGERRLEGGIILAALRDAWESGCAAALWPDTGMGRVAPRIFAGFLPYPRGFVMGGIGLNGYTPPMCKEYR
ncbi:MAG: GNAT family N-acetyltransferase, partial [Thermoplasmata archaeon]|nr:GNAT family N-acetyltransferase [Thermoplasmata archaeon]